SVFTESCSIVMCALVHLNHYSNAPVLHHSNLFLISYVLREPFQRQGMAKSSGFGEIVGCAANGGELKPLRSLVIEKRDLLVVGAANPSIGHDVRHGADVGII